MTPEEVERLYKSVLAFIRKRYANSTLLDEYEGAASRAVINTMAHFDPKQAKIVTFAIGIALRECINIWRAHHNADDLLVRFEELEKAEHVTPEPVLPDEPPDPRLPVMLECLKKLPKQDRKTIEMSYFQDMTYREIAAALGISPATVCRNMRIAKEKLKHRVSLHYQGLISPYQTQTSETANCKSRYHARNGDQNQTSRPAQGP